MRPVAEEVPEGWSKERNHEQKGRPSVPVHHPEPSGPPQGTLGRGADSPKTSPRTHPSVGALVFQDATSPSNTFPDRAS
jgi:hypothetical protein